MLKETETEEKTDFFVIGGNLNGGPGPSAPLATLMQLSKVYV